MKKIFILIFFVLFTIFLVGCENQYQNLELENEEIIPATKEYEVLSVHQYIENITNGFGGIMETNICYYFTYIDEEGNLKEEDSFENLEYGLTKVLIGDTNKYIIEEKGLDTYKYLYLTKETLQNIKLDNN